MDQQGAQRRHKELVEQGWIRRFSAEEPRLSEMKEAYEVLGMQVLVEPGMLGEDEECRSCFDAEGFEDRYKTLYTRGEEKSGKRADDELFD
jgi:hypothetical protein